MSRFAHILLFRCPACNLPVSVSRISSEKNMEGIDSELLDIDCGYCNSISKVTAITAKNHYVESWPQ